MTVHFKKKARKWRGRTSHGHGAKKKRRGGGSRGGRGLAGLHKHKYSAVTTHSIDYEFGYKGFHSLKKKEKAINVGDIEKVIDTENENNRNEVDLGKLGYSKLLSRGRISHPYKIKVSKFTERAKQKIEKAGGKIIIVEGKVKNKIAKVDKSGSVNRSFAKKENNAD